ncbi:MAG: metallopeptidase TldD-related protein [Candidatus Scalindua sp.]|nr:metallopeptidase TldD-related protein [Candidatus Scalindua sp.]MCR4344886.1 metallopeptidase TldD-related protein [Candidatus Scalindua sp.]
MIKIEDLRTAVADALKYIKKQKDVIDAEVFASWNDLITIRLNYTSDIPCNGIHEPKSIQSYGLGILATFKRGNRIETGFGSVTNDLTKEGVLEALEKAKRNRVYDPDFKTLPEPVDKPTLTNYHDKRVMEISGEETVDLGWKALGGALKTLRDGGHKKTIIIGGDVTILRERMAIKTTKGIDDFDETTSLAANITVMIESKNVKGMGWSMGTHLATFSPEAAGREAAESAMRTIGGMKVKSGRHNVIFGNQPLTDIVSNVLVPSLDLSSVYASNTPFLGKLGHGIASSNLNVCDDGSIKGEIGSKKITCEGIPTGRTDLITNGTLTGFLANNYYAHKFKNNLYNPIPRNGFRYSSIGRDYKNKPGISPTNVIIEGNRGTTRDNLLKQVDNGVYIGGIWYTYAINGLAMGDFTSTIIADSFAIKDGKIASPLKPNTIRINTNINHILNNIIGITKKKRSTLVWGSREVVAAPEIAVSNVQLENVTGFLA